MEMTQRTVKLFQLLLQIGQLNTAELFDILAT